MSWEQIVIAALSLFVIPSLVAGARYIRKTSDRLTKVEEFQGFLKTYLMKDAVLSFRSNPNPRTDEIIDKITSGEEVSVTEVKQLEDKLHRIAESSEEPTKKAKAENTLELMKWVFEDLESVEARADVRDRLFTE